MRPFCLAGAVPRPLRKTRQAINRRNTDTARFGGIFAT